MPPKANPIFNIFLVGFPLGIGILGIASIFIFYANRNAQNERASAGIDRRLQAAFRIPASEETIESYRRPLEDILGLQDSVKIANYLESSLGKSNLGYRTRRSGDETAPTITAIIEGSAPPLIIAAPYDRPGAAAALLTLATDLAGETPSSEIHLTAHHSATPIQALIILDGTGGLKAILAAATSAKK